MRGCCGIVVGVLRRVLFECCVSVVWALCEGAVWALCGGVEWWKIKEDGVGVVLEGTDGEWVEKERVV